MGGGGLGGGGRAFQINSSSSSSSSSSSAAAAAAAAAFHLTRCKSVETLSLAIVVCLVGCLELCEELRFGSV